LAAQPLCRRHLNKGKLASSDLSLRFAIVRASLISLFRFCVITGLGFVLHAPATHLSAMAQKISSKRKEDSVFQVRSNAFRHEGNIPPRFTCEGDNISPELTWTAAPQGTESFALIVHDPDAPRAGGYTHWVVFNIPATVTHIAENAPKDGKLPSGGIQGKNDGGSLGYTGPCPPSGTHRYHFHLYALDKELNLNAGADKASVERAIHGHVLAEAECMGRYRRGANKAA
jgi:Raf kinase inhibitor-like YbhB/YbcL family protein